MINDNKKIEREGVYLEYYKMFGKDPNIIGMFWRDIELLEKNIQKSIKDNKKYDEYEFLTKEEKELYDKGDLFF